MADGGGDPVAGGADAALVTGWAEVAGLAGKGEEAFVTAVWAVETGEAGAEVATTEEGFNGGDGGGVEGAEILAVPFFVVGEKFFPAVVDELPGGRGAGGGEAGRLTAQRVCIRTFFVRGKDEGDGSDVGKVRVAEFLTE